MIMAEMTPDNRPPAASTVKGANGGGLWQIEPMPPELIDTPLDFIFAEHLRQREAATILLAIADGDFSADGVGELVKFLKTDFALHIGDEEIVLFPILRQRCLPEDNIDAVIDRLQEEHREDEDIVEEVIETLEARLRGGVLGVNGIRRLRVFAEHIRQHLALENGVLLPIARVRLDEEDMALLTKQLKIRRA